MKKKNILIIAGLIIVVSIVTLIIRIFLSKDKLNLEPYQKYNMLVSIDTFHDGANKKYTINFTDDGANARLYSNIENFDGFLLENKLCYAYQDTIYSIDLKRNYRNLNEILGNLKKGDLVDKKADGIARYSSLLKLGVVNKLLDALGIEKDTKNSVILKFVVSARHVSSANFTVSDLEGYGKTEIMITFKELNEDFKVNTDVLTNNPHRLYKQVTLSENPLSIMR